MVLVAIVNLLLLYYVVFNGSLEVDKKYVTNKFQARLPKDLNQEEHVKDEETSSKPANSTISTLNPLIELMKNKLFDQKENDRNDSSINHEDNNVTLEESQLSEELKEKLLDSSEIVLVTKPPPNPKLYLQSHVINTSQEFLNLMEDRVDLLRNHCSKHRQSNKVNSQYLYVLQVTL